MSPCRQPLSQLEAGPCLQVLFLRQQLLPLHLPLPQLQPPQPPLLSNLLHPTLAKPASHLLTPLQRLQPSQPVPCTACVPRHRHRRYPATARRASPSTAAVTAATRTTTKTFFTFLALALPPLSTRRSHLANYETRSVRRVAASVLFLPRRRPQRRHRASRGGVFSLLSKQRFLLGFLLLYQPCRVRVRVRLVLRSSYRSDLTCLAWFNKASRSFILFMTLIVSSCTNLFFCIFQRLLLCSFTLIWHFCPFHLTCPLSGIQSLFLSLVDIHLEFIGLLYLSSVYI